MSRARSLFCVLQTWFSKVWAQWLVAVAIFFLFSFFYMGPAITGCNNYSPALFSDSSGGIGWSQWASGNQPTWGYTKASNFPEGENINRPQEITSQALLVPYRIFAWLTSPTCGLNLLILLGYMSTGLMMFGLVRWLFRRPAIAIFAGYAAAFVPYHQLKSQSHITYISSAAFIGIVWVYLWFIQKPSYKKISLLAVISAISMYEDGYLTLLTFTLLTILFGALVFSKSDGKKSRGRLGFIAYLLQTAARNIRIYYKHVALFVVLLLLLILPVVSYQLRHGSEVQQALASGRGEILFEAKAYSARPAEYLIPPYNNFLVPETYTHWRLVHQHGSNPSEDTLFLGYTVLILAGFALVFSLRPKFAGLNLKNNISFRYLVWLILIIALICFTLSLPPIVTVLGHRLRLPTDIIIKITSYWRVFARYFLIIAPMTVILSAAALYAITRKWSWLRATALVGFCLVILFFEFLPSPHRAIADLYANTPTVYKDLAKDRSTKVVAEYPMLNFALEPLTFTFQQVHQKNLINANDATFIKGPFIQSICGLNDAQTLGVLKAEGATVVTTLGIDMGSNGNLITYQPPDTSSAGFGVPAIYSYKISERVTPKKVLLAPLKNFDTATVDDNQLSHHVIHGAADAELLSLSHATAPAGHYVASFNAVSLSGHDIKFVVKESNKVLWEGVISTNPTSVSFLADGENAITLVPNGHADITDMQAEIASE